MKRYSSNPLLLLLFLFLVFESNWSRRYAGFYHRPIDNFNFFVLCYLIKITEEMNSTAKRGVIRSNKIILHVHDWLNSIIS